MLYYVLEGGQATIHNYKMYRPRSTYLAAATITLDYSKEMNGAREFPPRVPVRGSSVQNGDYKL